MLVTSRDPVGSPDQGVQSGTSVIGRTGAAGAAEPKVVALPHRADFHRWVAHPFRVAGGPGGLGGHAIRAPRREWPNGRWYGGLLANGAPREYKGYANWQVSAQ